MSLFRKQPDPREPQERFNGLPGADFSTLARYNAERARGIMHAPEWQEKMAALQSRFDAAERDRLGALMLAEFGVGGESAEEGGGD